MDGIHVIVNDGRMCPRPHEWTIVNDVFFGYFSADFFLFQFANINYINFDNFGVCTQNAVKGLMMRVSVVCWACVHDMCAINIYDNYNYTSNSKILNVCFHQFNGFNFAAGTPIGSVVGLHYMCIAICCVEMGYTHCIRGHASKTTRLTAHERRL